MGNKYMPIGICLMLSSWQFVGCASSGAQGPDINSAGNTDGEGSSESADGAPSEEPKFVPGMSVLEANNAVSMNAPRLEVEQDRLAEPLMDPKTYEPCKLQSQSHFKVTVAVWDGKAVGLDLTTTPKNEELEECLIGQFRALTWPDRVKSLNTVEYSF